MRTVEELKTAHAILMQEIAATKNRLNEQSRQAQELRLLFMEREYGLKVGGLVKGPGGVVYQVERLHGGCESLDEPWLFGHKRLKNGSFGKQRRLIFSWEVVV